MKLFYSDLNYFLAILIGFFIIYLSDAITPQNRQIGDLEYDSQVAVSHDGDFNMEKKAHLSNNGQKDDSTAEDKGADDMKVDCKLPCDDFDANCDCKAASVKTIGKDHIKETINNWIENNGKIENRINEMRLNDDNLKMTKNMNKEKNNISIKGENRNSMNSAHQNSIRDSSRTEEITSTTTTTTSSSKTDSIGGLTTTIGFNSTTTEAVPAGVDTNLLLIGGVGGGIILILGVFAYQKYRNSNADQSQQGMRIDPNTGMPMGPGAIPGMPMSPALPGAMPGAGPGMPMVGNPEMQRNSGYGIY